MALCLDIRVARHEVPRVRDGSGVGRRCAGVLAGGLANRLQYRQTLYGLRRLTVDVRNPVPRRPKSSRT